MNWLMLLASTIAVSVVHEGCHALAARVQGLAVRRIGVNRRGLYVVRQSGTPRQNLLVTLAGPLANLLLALLCWGSGFALLNLVFGVANLIPLPSSDGRRAYAEFRKITTEPERIEERRKAA